MRHLLRSAPTGAPSSLLSSAPGALAHSYVAYTALTQCTPRRSRRLYREALFLCLLMCLRYCWAVGPVTSLCCSLLFCRCPCLLCSLFLLLCSSLSALLCCCSALLRALLGAPLFARLSRSSLLFYARYVGAPLLALPLLFSALLGALLWSRTTTTLSYFKKI